MLHDSMLIEADAEIAKSSGGMLALLPRQDFAEAMVVQGGEPIEDLHLTLAYFGEDVTGLPVDGLAQDTGTIADMLITAVRARVFAHAIFNPDGGPSGQSDPCSVYLVSDSEVLGPLRAAVQEAARKNLGANLPNQHEPFVPHITASYAIQNLTFTGEVIFDRLSLNWAGQKQEYPLIDR